MYVSIRRASLFSFFFFNDTATTEIYTLSLHDALPICVRGGAVLKHRFRHRSRGQPAGRRDSPGRSGDRKSTRLNSSHSQISYAVFCLKKKRTTSALATLGQLLPRSPCLSCPTRIALVP